jgi:hypothetical protein
MVGVETCLGAALGMVLAGDRPAPGESGPTGLAFVLVLVGALVVARFGSPDHSRTPVLDGSDGGPRADDAGPHERSTPRVPEDAARCVPQVRDR